ncbi:RNase H domain-containing protein [Caerostris extrusa]|uniref:RNase H domain-containing protein n=1 Tax=Caerostris extrusa TaxID=172846 RepID=A0AAV4RRV3_CAEEX|nr:RNase H domain-containing protein [Caerostris extrusa]
MNDRVGGAFVVLQQDKETFFRSFRLSDWATVYMAELVAIEKAIDFAISHSFSPVNVISDSRSVKFVCSGLKLMLATWEMKEQTRLPKKLPISRQFKSTPYLHFIKQTIKKDILAEWQDRWSNSIKGREVFILLPKVNLTRVQGDFFINQLISGHGTLAAYQNRFLERLQPALVDTHWKTGSISSLIAPSGTVFVRNSSRQSSRVLRLSSYSLMTDPEMD